MTIANILHLVNMSLAGILMASYYISFLKPRFDKKLTYIAGCVCMALLNIVFSFWERSVLKSASCLLLILLYVIISFKDKPAKMVFAYISENCAVLLADIMASGFWYLGGFYNSLHLGTTVINNERIIIEAFVVVALLNVNILFMYIKNRFEKINDYKNRMTVIFPFFVWINILTVGEAYLFVKVEAKLYFYYVVVVVVFTLLELILTIYLLQCIYEGEIKMQELKMMEEENCRNKQIYQKRWDEYQKMRELRHDAANYIQTIECLRYQDKEKAEEMLDILEKRIREE